MREIKSAVIGCGLISKNHLKALRNVEGARCGAVCDIVRERQRQWQGLTQKTERSGSMRIIMSS